jgi:hypothetical protein
MPLNVIIFKTKICIIKILRLGLEVQHRLFMYMITKLFLKIRQSFFFNWLIRKNLPRLVRQSFANRSYEWLRSKIGLKQDLASFGIVSLLREKKVFRKLVQKTLSWNEWHVAPKCLFLKVCFINCGQNNVFD